jgi:hypothetical protein
MKLSNRVCPECFRCTNPHELKDNVVYGIVIDPTPCVGCVAFQAHQSYVKNLFNQPVKDEE